MFRVANKAECVICAQCGLEFCSLCKSHPYHYMAQCGAVASIRANYVAWITRGRLAFLEFMAARDRYLPAHHNPNNPNNPKGTVDDFVNPDTSISCRQHQAALENHKRERARFDTEQQQLRTNVAQFAADEAWKQQNCRRYLRILFVSTLYASLLFQLPSLRTCDQ